MPDLAESLQGRDLGHLRIIAELWGLALEEQELPSAILHLTRSLANFESVDSTLSRLSPDAKLALEDLVKHGGRLPWAQFSRQYGEVREMGAARRDREQPHQNPISGVEELWYRGMLARAFFDTPAGPEEFAYIPSDLLELMPGSAARDAAVLGRPASSTEYTTPFLASGQLLDHACTFLAALRMGVTLPESFKTPVGEELSQVFIASLLGARGLLDEAGLLIPEAVRQFLEAGRGDAMLQLYLAWRKSSRINELAMLPGLSIEGNWENDPLATRQVILESLSHIPADTWWSINAFFSAFKGRNPDFQRPSGDYDSWFIREIESGEYLRGFESWDKVDGRLIRFLLTGPFYWLGILDLACPDAGQQVTAFRLSKWADVLLHESAPKGLLPENQPLIVRSDSRISATRLVPRWVRYQVARFCDWEKETPDEYVYRVSAASLAHARKQGLKVSQLTALLNRHAKAVPPSLARAMERWDEHGSEVRLEQMVVLRVASEEILQILRKSRASRFLGEPLGLTTVAIKQGAIDKVLNVLAELGYLGEIRGEIE